MWEIGNIFNSCQKVMSDIAAQMDNNTMSNHHAHAVATGYALSLRVDHQMNKTIKVVVFKALNI